MANHSWSILPRTAWGKWSLGLIAAMPLLFLLGTSLASRLYPAVPAGDTLLADIAARPLLALTMLAGVSAGVLAFVTGLLAIFRSHERAALVVLSSLAGGLVLLFVLGQALLPD